MYIRINKNLYLINQIYNVNINVNRLENINNELLAKLIKENINKNILDLTGGFIQDALLFTTHNCYVNVIEKKPLIIKLIKIELKKPYLKKLSKNIKIIYGNSLNIIKKIKKNFFLIYMDTMFQYKNSILCKNKIQILKILSNGFEKEENNLFKTVINLNKKLIVKRNINSEYINHKKPDYSIFGKYIRFDVYLSGTDSNRRPNG